MRGVVLLAYYFPPLVGIASERAASFARHLSALGWRVVVVAPRAGFYLRDAGAGAAPPEPEGVRVVRTPSPEPARGLRRLLRGPEPAVEPGEIRPLEAGRLGARLRRVVREWVYLPDAQVGWIPFAARAARTAVRDGGAGTVLLSSSVPYSAHLAALVVARRTGVPWVAEFRDPWSALSPALRPRSPLRRALDRRLEAWVVGRADRLVVTSEATRRSFLGTYPFLGEEGVAVVRNGFEPLSDAPEPPAPGEPLRLVYAGTVAPEVPVEPLLEGVVRVVRGAPGEVVLRVVGPSGPWEGGAGKVDGGSGWLQLAGVVSPARARMEMAGASANVLLVPRKVYRLHVAGKLYEYLGARRPILAAVHPDGEMAELARRHGDLRLLDPYTPETAEREVLRLLQEHREGRLRAPTVPEELVAPLTRRAQAERLAAALAETLRTRAPGGRGG